METVAELLDRPPDPDHPSPAAVVDLRRRLVDGLTAVTADHDGPDGTLGISKRRLLDAVRCPASVAAELAPSPMSEPLVIGILVDLAAALLVFSDKVPGRAPWLGALEPVVAQESPEVGAFIAALPVEDRDRLRTDLQDRCSRLPTLLGDVRGQPVTTQEWFRVELDGPGVRLTGRTDLVFGTARRTLVEVKSGRPAPTQVDEAGYYALLAALRDGVAPVGTAVLTLDPGATSYLPVTLDQLEAAAARVIEAAQALVAVDRATAAGRWPPTRPGPFCGWCGVVDRCPDAPDLAKAEYEGRGPIEPLDPEEEPW